MVVTKAIPRTINIGGFPITFNYRGQPTQCFICLEVDHADLKIQLDGAAKAIQTTSEADSPLRVQSHTTMPAHTAV